MPSPKNKLRIGALSALLVVVAVLCFMRLRRESSPEVSPEPAQPSARPALPPAPAPTSVGPPAKPAAPVYLRIDGIKLLRAAGPHVRVHLRANVNSAYYDYPSDPGDAGIAWVEVDSQVKGQRFAIARSFMYEAYLEMQIRGGDRLSGNAETLELTSPSGALSDKLPFSEDYKLYATGHGMKAAEPSAVVSYTITETP